MWPKHMKVTIDILMYSCLSWSYTMCRHLIEINTETFLLLKKI